MLRYQEITGAAVRGGGRGARGGGAERGARGAGGAGGARPGHREQCGRGAQPARKRPAASHNKYPPHNIQHPTLFIKLR